MTFNSRHEKIMVCETMADLLSQLKYHCDAVTKESIEITLRILSETGYIDNTKEGFKK